MISGISEMPITDESYPFSSAERYCHLSAYGYVEREYRVDGTANVYRTADEDGGVEVMTADAPYSNRIVVRAPKDPAQASGNVVVEIINPTSFMEIERMWILGYGEFVRSGDIYVGITSKPNTIAKLKEFNPDRYGFMSWANPTPERPFDYDPKQLERGGALPDMDISYETGLFWDMLTDLAWLLRGDSDLNPIRDYPRQTICLTGWSQSGAYLFRYLNSFAYREDVCRDGRVFDGYLSGGGIHSMCIPVNQYESDRGYAHHLLRVEHAEEPFIALQTESENGRFESWRTLIPDSDDPDFKYRLYEVTGSSHDTQWSYVDYYQDDEDLKRIDHLPVYVGKHAEANAYPSQYLFHAAFRNLFRWVRTGAAPATCPRIELDTNGENVKDALGTPRAAFALACSSIRLPAIPTRVWWSRARARSTRRATRMDCLAIWSRFRHRCSRSCTDRLITTVPCASAIRQSKCRKASFALRTPRRSLTLP